MLALTHFATSTQRKLTCAQQVSYLKYSWKSVEFEMNNKTIEQYSFISHEKYGVPKLSYTISSLHLHKHSVRIYFVANMYPHYKLSQEKNYTTED